MKVDGRCHCGQIRYEAQIDPGTVSVCHCTDCQMLTGTAYRVSVPASAANLAFLSGHTEDLRQDGGERQPARARHFAPNCGTPLYSADAQDPQVYFLRVGTLSQRAALPPKRQIWCRSALPWASDIRNLAPSERA